MSTSVKPIAIIIYSMYGHIEALAQSVKKGIESAGHKATIYQVKETLSDEVRTYAWSLAAVVLT